MSLIDSARDVLKNLVLTETAHERIALAIDRLADAEAQIQQLQLQVGSLTAQLERERIDHKKTQFELATIQKLHEEHVRIFHGIEFKKGIRTGNQWLPFCPKCNLPLVIDDQPDVYPVCTDRECGWSSSVQNQKFRNIEPQ